jgi:hypothetical protein
MVETSITTLQLCSTLSTVVVLMYVAFFSIQVECSKDSSLLIAIIINFENKSSKRNISATDDSKD